MSARKRSALPSSNPHYILSLLEENSSDESDSDLYSDSNDEELSPSRTSPTGSFQSQNNSPVFLDPLSSFQSSLVSSTQGTSSFQSLSEIATYSSPSTAYFSSSQSSTTRSSLQLSPSITSSFHSFYLNTSPISPLPLPPPVILNTSNIIAGSAIQGTSAPSFAVATTSSMTHYGLETHPSKFVMHTSNKNYYKTSLV